MLVGSVVVQNKPLFIAQLVDTPHASTPAAEKSV